jgi:hypothetical protein
LPKTGKKKKINKKKNCVRHERAPNKNLTHQLKLSNTIELKTPYQKLNQPILTLVTTSKPSSPLQPNTVAEIRPRPLKPTVGDISLSLSIYLSLSLGSSLSLSLSLDSHRTPPPEAFAIIHPRPPKHIKIKKK